MSTKGKAAFSLQLDGTLAAVIKEIRRLHGEIFTAARMTLKKAIRIGELLTRVKSSRKGKWLLWLKDNVPFDARTAQRYMACYKRRDELKNDNVSYLSEAYPMLSLPSREKPGGRQGRDLSPEPCPQATKPRRRKRKDTIMDAISPENQKRDLQQGQREIDKQLSDIIQQIDRQADSPSLAGAHWPEFPDRLAVHGNALIQQGERLRDANTR